MEYDDDDAWWDDDDPWFHDDELYCDDDLPHDSHSWGTQYLLFCPGQ